MIGVVPRVIHLLERQTLRLWATPVQAAEQLELASIE